MGNRATRYGMMVAGLTASAAIAGQALAFNLVVPPRLNLPSAVILVGVAPPPPAPGAGSTVTTALGQLQDVFTGPLPGRSAEFGSLASRFDRIFTSANFSSALRTGNVASISGTEPDIDRVVASLIGQDSVTRLELAYQKVREAYERRQQVRANGWRASSEYRRFTREQREWREAYQQEITQLREQRHNLRLIGPVTPQSLRT